MKSEIIIKFRVKQPEHKMAIDILKKSHSILEKELGVQSHLIIFNEKKNVSKTLQGVYRDDLKCISLNLFTCETIKGSVTVLSHEFRHALQYKNKWISKKASNECGSWKGKRYKGDYWDLPWEKDARKWADVYTKKIIDKLNLKRKGMIKI